LFDTLKGPDRAKQRDRDTATDTDRHRHRATDSQTKTGRAYLFTRNRQGRPKTKRQPAKQADTATAGQSKHKKEVKQGNGPKSPKRAKITV
jgi:hypothetical protein